MSLNAQPPGPPAPALMTEEAALAGREGQALWHTVARYHSKHFPSAITGTSCGQLSLSSGRKSKLRATVTSPGHSPSDVGLVSAPALVAPGHTV